MIARSTKKPKTRSKYDDDDEYDLRVKPIKPKKPKAVKKTKKPKSKKK